MSRSTSLLDEREFSIQRWDARRLRDVMISAYGDRARIRELAASVGLRHTDFNLDAVRIRDVWLDLLETAARAKLLRQLVEAAANDATVGAYALRINPRDPTMVLDGFTGDTDKAELRRTVLHEFGHAIGCIHEQASPAVQIPWDEEKVYAYYRGWQGWDRETTYHNVLRRYSGTEVYYSDYDPHSIMQYPVSPELTHGGFSIAWNNELSEGDRSFIARMYPRAT